MTCNRYALAVGLACALVPPLSGAQIYKCTGPDGRTLYSQTPFAAGACQAAKVSAPPPSGADGGNLGKYAKEVDKANGARAEAQQKSDQQAARKQQACEQSRSRLAMLQQAARLFTTDANGERHYASDAEHDAATAQAQAAVAQYCQ